MFDLWIKRQVAVGAPPLSHSRATTLLPVIQLLLRQQSSKHAFPLVPKQLNISSPDACVHSNKAIDPFSLLYMCQELAPIFNIRVSFNLAKIC